MLSVLEGQSGAVSSVSGALSSMSTPLSEVVYSCTYVPLVSSPHPWCLVPIPGV